MWWALNEENSYRCMSVVLTDLLATLRTPLSNSTRGSRQLQRQHASKPGTTPMSIYSRYIQNSEPKVSKVFPQFQVTNLDAYFNLVISTMPSIVLKSQPAIPSKEEEKAGHANPYQPLIHSLQTFMWTLHELEKLIDEEEAILFILKTSVITTRSCRAMLEAILGALDTCTDWRSLQDLVYDDDGDGHMDDVDNNTVHDDDYSNHKEKDFVSDWGSVTYLQSALEWCMKCGALIGHFGMIFKEKIIIPGNFEIPSHLIRNLPALQNDVNTFTTKITRISITHGNNKIIAPSLTSSSASLIHQSLHTAATDYRTRFELVLSVYKGIFDTPVSSAMFAVSGDRGSSIWASRRGLLQSSSSSSMLIDDNLNGSSASMDQAKTSFDIFFNSRDKGGSNGIISSGTVGSSSQTNDPSVSSFGVRMSHDANGDFDGNENGGWGIYNYDTYDNYNDGQVSNSDNEVYEDELSGEFSDYSDY